MNPSRNLRIGIVFTLVIAAVICTGCTSSKIIARPRPELGTAATLSFTRGSQFLYSAQPAIVSVDGIESASVEQDQQFTILLSPGFHDISIRSENSGQSTLSEKVNLGAKESQFFEIYPNPKLLPMSLIPMSHYAIIPFLLKPITEDSFKSQGRSEIKVPYVEK